MIFTPAPTRSVGRVLGGLGGDREHADDDVPVADDVVERARTG